MTCMTCLYMDGNIDFIGGAESAPPPGQNRSLYIPVFLGLNLFIVSDYIKLLVDSQISITDFYRQYIEYTVHTLCIHIEGYIYIVSCRGSMRYSFTIFHAFIEEILYNWKRCQFGNLHNAQDLKKDVFPSFLTMKPFVCSICFQ